MSEIPPPPPGFTLDIPPPPPGFTLDGASAAVTEPELARAPAPAAADSSPYAAYPSGSPMDVSAGDTTPTADFAEKVGQGFFANYGDEIAALLGSLPSVATGGKYGKSRKEILADVRDREKRFDTEHPEAAAVGEIGGALGSAAGTGFGALGMAGAAPGIGRAMLAGGLGAAPLGALDATGRMEGEHTAGEYGAEAGKGAAVAGGIGALTAGAGNAIGKVVGPWASDAAQRLTGRGVQLTPGEVIGGNASRFESGILGSTPVISGQLRSRAAEGVESLNREASRDAMAPMGATAQRVVQRAEPGHDTVTQMTRSLERRYGSVVPRLTAAVDNDFTADLARAGAQVPASVRHEFDDAVERYVTSVTDQATGTIPGPQLQQSLRSLREAGRRLRASTAHPWHGDLGEALGGVREALENSAARHSAPRDVAAFRAVNNAYSRFAIVRDAASRVTSEGGVFSPANLHGAVRAADKSAGKGQMARGHARMQDLSDDARAVMTPKGAGSPTAERTALLGTGAALATNPILVAKLLTAGLPVSALYTRPGSRAFQTMATFSPNTRAALRRAMERAGIAGAPAAGIEGARE